MELPSAAVLLSFVKMVFYRDTVIQSILDLVPINIDGKVLTNMTCDGKGHNSTWIDISTGQPARQDACGCPAPEFKNGMNINSTCYVAGVGGPPGCTVDATCGPGKGEEGLL